MLLVGEDFSPKELAFALQELLLQLESSLSLDEPQRTSFLPVSPSISHGAVVHDSNPVYGSPRVCRKYNRSVPYKAAMKKEVVAVRRPPIEIVHFVVELLPILTVFVEDLANKIKVSWALSSCEEMLELFLELFSFLLQGNGEDLEDSVLEPENVGCLRLCFSILNSLLSWRGFNEPKHSKVGHSRLLRP